MIVTLGAPDLSQIVLLADRRNWQKEGAVKSKKFTDRYTEFEAHLLGAAAEYAGAKVLGVSLDESRKMNGDGGVDCTLGGFSVDIKATMFDGDGEAELKFNSLEDFKTDVVLFVVSLSLCRHRVAGVISKDRFRTLAKQKDYGYGVRYFVGESALSEPMKFIEYARKRENSA